LAVLEVDVNLPTCVIEVDLYEPGKGSINLMSCLMEVSEISRIAEKMVVKG
jgi:hypothetical protein